MSEHTTIGTAQIGVWGLGLIGYTLAGELARTGRRCLVIDVDAERVNRLNRGELPFRHLPALERNYADEVRVGRLAATTDAAALLTADCAAHVLCVPTERDGEVDSTTLAQVVRQIAHGAKARPLHVVIESTIAPAWLDSVVHPELAGAGLRRGVDYHLGVSPRRDWLTGQGRTMASMPKIIGGDSPEAVRMMRELYEGVCDEVLVAHDAKHAALVKVVENYFRYRDIMVANELGTLLPSFDIASVLRLAATKWNMELYHPSLGIGGYCVPLAKDYLGQEPETETFATELGIEEEKLYSSARSALRAHGRFRTVAVLGIAYASGMKIHTRSPGLRLAKELAAEGSTVLVHDPLYSPAELARLTGGVPVEFPDGLGACDSVLVATDHELYREVYQDQLLAGLAPDVCIVDNLGTWRDRGFPASVHYVEVGGRHYFDAGRPKRPSQTCRTFLRDTPGEEVFASANRVVAIDRRYLSLDVDGVAMSMGELGGLLAELRNRPEAEWTDAQAQVLCVLYAVDQAGVRLEQLGITSDLDLVAAQLATQLDAYRSRLLALGDEAGPAADELPWWEAAKRLPVLRQAIDRHFLRLLEIDGRNWHRAERLLPLDRLGGVELPEPLAAELVARHPRVPADTVKVAEYLSALTRAEIAATGSPMELLATIMRHAAEDPRHPSDHATLMCPRGTNVGQPGKLAKEDFGIFVVFNREFVPQREAGVGDYDAIRRAMFAHHAAKKVRVARKVYDPDGTYTQAGLTDDLGGRGIFFNEGVHHRGHVLAGVSSAMRSLMSIDVAVDGERRTLHDLTDWRLSRTSADPGDRYSTADYPSFYAYGIWLRVVVETSIGEGARLPAMLGEWR